MSEVQEIAGKRRKCKGTKGEAWGILNPYGDIWTHETFRSPEAAMQHVEGFWRGIKNAGDLSRFKPVRVNVHVTIKPDNDFGSAVRAHLQATQAD